MKLPVHILDQDDNIPLPGGNYLLDLPTEAEEHLRFIDVKTGPTTIEKRILFLTPKQISGTDYNTEDLVHKVGSVGIFMEREPADTFVLFSFNINDRFRIASIETDEDGITWAEGHSMIEEFSPGEQELPELMISIYNNLNQHKEVLEPSVHKALNSTKFLLRKMDILANYLLTDRHDRISYLQQTENLDRWNLVIEHLRTYLKKGRPLKPKRVKDLVSKVPAPTKPVEIPMTLTERLQKLVLPDNVRPSVDKELERLERSNKSGSEYSMLQDYLSWVADLPWGQSSTKEFELDELKTQLDVSHHGLDDVKEYILEHFCMERISGASGSVLCFAGPAGVGKTTIAKEIARVSGRPLIRIALGGLSDEAECRGHRRTYLGARCGRFIAGLRDAKKMDPVFLLDEIDKVTRGHGDPASALLEILDPEQNTHFIDRYLEFPVDLSKALFICTANDPDLMHSALLDRMSLIHFRDYTEDERRTITFTHLIPKIVREYKLEQYPIVLEDNVVERLIKLKQLRQIEKKLRRLYRMAAVQIYVMKKDKQVIDIKFASAILQVQEREAIGFGR